MNKVLFLTGAFAGSLFFINAIPPATTSDVSILSCIHLLFFLWSLLAIAFVGNTPDHVNMRLRFLKFNGDLAIITTLILIAGGILTGLTVTLFSLIRINIAELNLQYVLAFIVPAAPIVGAYLIDSNPQLVGRVSPLLARIFSPLVAIMLLVYLAAIIYSGKDPYNDRESLLVFNVLLIGVMAIIFFAVAGTSKSIRNKMELWTLVILSLITVIVNCIALSAILFRIAEWGITPNRAAVLGANLLILVNLILVMLKLAKVVSGKSDIHAVEKTIADYLPVYVAWSMLVTFGFPVIFA